MIKLYVINFEYGQNVSGILPERFTDKDLAQDQCDYENMIYNNVKHWVEVVDDSHTT